jgi:hypothetical protein
MLSQVNAKIKANNQQAIRKGDYAHLRRLGVREAVALSTVRSHLFNSHRKTDEVKASPIVDASTAINGFMG